MASIQIESSQNIKLDLELANGLERSLATFIDWFILLGYYFIVSLFSNYDFFDLNSENLTVKEFKEIILYTFPMYFYHLVSEVLTKGRSIGKVIMKTRVVKLNGESPGFLDYAIRWIFRMIDIWGVFLFTIIIAQSFHLNWLQVISFLLFPGLIAILSVSVFKSKQRFGDLMAGTVLIKNRNQYSLSDTILQKTSSNYVVTFPSVLRLSDKDVRLIKETIEYYEKTKDSIYVEKLAKKAIEFLQIDKPKENSFIFLKKIISDYNHLAMQEDARL